jgi:hypothetical protein
MAKQANQSIPVDITMLAQQVLRESHRQATEDLNSAVEALRASNESRKAVRAYVAALRKFRVRVIAAARAKGLGLCPDDDKSLRVIAALFQQHAQTYTVGDLEYALCIPLRVPAKGVQDFAQLDTEIAKWNDDLSFMADDAQLTSPLSWNIGLPPMFRRHPSADGEQLFLRRRGRQRPWHFSDQFQ